MVRHTLKYKSWIYRFLIESHVHVWFWLNYLDWYRFLVETKFFYFVLQWKTFTLPLQFHFLSNRMQTLLQSHRCNSRVHQTWKKLFKANNRAVARKFRARGKPNFGAPSIKTLRHSFCRVTSDSFVGRGERKGLEKQTKKVFRLVKRRIFFPKWKLGTTGWKRRTCP